VAKSEAIPHVDAPRFVGAIMLVGFQWQNSLSPAMLVSR